MGGCKSDLFGGRDEKTCKRFHCATDNFDLCEKCMLASYTTDRIVSMRFAEGLYEGFVNSNNQKHGKGKFEFISKVVYIGEYFNNVRQGYGEMFYTNGNKRRKKLILSIFLCLFVSRGQIWRKLWYE